MLHNVPPWLTFVVVCALWLGLAPHRTTAARVRPRLGRVVFALWDNRSDSTVGAIENARLVPTVLLGWGTQFYVHSTNVDSGVVAVLRSHGADVVVVPGNGTAAPALWPFRAADLSPEPICIREVVSRPSLREAAMLGIWLRSAYPFHAIRDHHLLSPEQDPHLWCAKAGQLPAALGAPVHQLLAGAAAGSAAAFMRQRVYPAVANRTLRHDAFSCEHFHPLPVVRRARGYVGQRHNYRGVPQRGGTTPRRLLTQEQRCTRPAWLHLISQVFLPSSPVRRREIVGALHSWLQNPSVLKVHLMGQNRSHFDEALSGLPVTQQQMVVFVPLSRQMLYEDAFGYASTALNNTFCMVLNSDIGLGVGFNLLGWEYLEHVRPYLLSLSRHPSPYCMAEEFDQCDVYRGSHDAFLFVPPIRPSALRRLAFRQNLFGAENALMHELRHERKLLNPCQQLHIHHFHCSNERAWHTGRAAAPVHRRGCKLWPQPLPFPVAPALGA